MARAAGEATTQLLAEVQALYDRALYRQAWQRGRPLGELKAWPGIEGRILAGRLAWCFGDSRLGDALFNLAWRSNRSNPKALYYRSLVILHRRGPLHSWRFLRARGELEGACVELRADWLAQHAAALAQLRDFGRAAEYLDRAEALAPDRPWVWVERAAVLDEEDRREEALEAAERALRLRHGYRPAIQRAAHLLHQLGRSDTALELLQEASCRLEAPGVTRQLVSSLMERERYADARLAVKRLVDITPLRGKRFVENVNGLYSDIAYHLGDLDAARRYAAKAGEGFFAAIVERLGEAPAESRIVRLPVKFVRQNFVTCAPATLSALASYWDRPVTHERLAEEICYDGTPDHVERDWAEGIGFATAEFRVTWDSARALLNRGVPFTVTTGGATWGHLQAIIGYDEHRATLLVLEPGSHTRCEYLAQEWLEAHRSFGPRGLALVPADRRNLLEGLELPDAELYDCRYRLKRALAAHDRRQAVLQYQAMRELDRDHPLAIDGLWSISRYDSDPETDLACVDRLLSIYEHDPRLELTKLSLMRNLSQRRELLTFLREVADRPGSDPIFQQELAEELMLDARSWEEARRRLERVVSSRRREASTHWVLAELAHREARFEEALELYRFAACLAPMNEPFSYVFFATSRLVGRSDEGIAFLRERVATLGDKSGQPAITLHQALAELVRNREAFAVLDAARQRRPDDMELVLFEAGRRGAYGEHERAAALLARADGAAKRSEWLGVAAELAGYAGDSERALALSLELARLAPLRVEAHRGALQGLHRLRGSDAVVEYVQAMLKRTPDLLPVQQLGIEWLRRDRPAESEAALRRLLQRHPGHAWAHRELALLCSEQGRSDEAKPEAEESLRLEPHAASSHSVLGEVLREQGDLDSAREAWQQTLRLDIDHSAALHSLIESCQSNPERRQLLGWVAAELEQQVVYGQGVIAYRETARAAMQPEEVLRLLRGILEKRPDMRAAWSETIHHLTEMGRLDEALELARRAADRFPFDSRSWYDLGVVQRSLHRGDACIEAFERESELSPGGERAICDLADAYQVAGRTDDARALLEKAVARSPRDARHRVYLADLLCSMGQSQAAREELERALLLEPDYPWAWSQHQSWSQHLGERGATRAFARRLTEERPRDAQAWLALAARCSVDGEIQQALEAVERAALLAPRNDQVHDQRARLLAKLGRFDEALEACRPAAFGARPPAVLAARRAWIESQRGDMDAAISLMRAVVDEDNGLYWGWICLSSWYEGCGQEDAALEAATWMSRLEPRNPEAWGRLADLRLRQDDRAGAREAYGRALEASPNAVAAGLALLDLLLENRECDAAEETAALLGRHGGGPWVVAREIQLARLRGDTVRAEACLRRVIGEHCDSSWPLAESFAVWVRPMADATRFEPDRPEQILAEAVAADRAGGQALLHYARDRWREGDTEGRLRALERAVSLEPGWDYAARALGDAYQSLQRHDEARRVLEELVERSPDEADNHAFLADLLAETGDLKSAIASMKRSLEMRPDSDWGWQALANWYSETGRPGAHKGFALQLTREQPRNVQVWLARVDVLTDENEVEERLEACRTAVSIDPLDTDTHDRLACVLAELERYDEALEACRPPIFDRLPINLRGRATWVTALRGDLDEAIASTRTLVEESPDYCFGWLNLCDWIREKEDWTEAEQCAREMVEQLPDHAVAHDALGTALANANKLEEAKKAYLRAHALDPELPNAFYCAFDLLLEDDDLAQAEQILSAYIREQRNEYSLARLLQLLCAKRERAAAEEAMSELCSLSVDSSWPLQAAWEAFLARGWRKHAARILTRAVSEGSSASQASIAWVSRYALHKRGRATETALIQLFHRQDVGLIAADTYLEVTPLDARFRRIQKACADLFALETRAWGSVGHALVRHRRFAEARRWLRDWRCRADVAPWIFHNLVKALRYQGEWEEAGEVGRAALHAWGEGEETSLFAVWHAFDDALVGRNRTAALRLERCCQQALPEYQDLIAKLALACLAAADACPFEEPPGRTPGARAIKAMRLLRPRIHAMTKNKNRELRVAYLRAAHRIATNSDQLGVKLWLGFQHLRMLAHLDLAALPGTFLRRLRRRD